MQTRRRFGLAAAGLAALASLLGGASQAGASPMTYTEMATASGTLGGNPFTNALVTIALNGDTANVTFGPLGFVNPVGTFTVNVAGLGMATFTDAAFVFDVQPAIAQRAGFSDTTVGRPIMVTVDPAFASYDLTTPIGPVTNSSIIAPDATFATTLGGLNFTSAGNSTFTAFVTPPAVPEPASLTLLGLGVAGLGLRAWRHRSRA